MTIPNSLANLSGSLQVSLLDENFTYLDNLPKFVTGMIMMWSGSISTIPSGWLLCNGSNGTPDLRNKFIIGAHSDTSGIANTTITGSNTQSGGSADAIVVNHTHTGTTNNNGTHSHLIWGQDNGAPPTGGASNEVANVENPTSFFSRSTDTAGDHNHTFTTAAAGSSGTNANLPPYYALAYIMKA